MIYNGVMRVIPILIVSLMLSPFVAADVRTQLTGFEWTLDKEQWADSSHLDDIIDIVLSTDELPFIRGRALQVLTLFPGKKAAEAYLSIIASEKGPLRRRAVDCICQWPVVDIPTDLLVPLLESADLHLSLRAAKCLGQNHGDNEAILQALERFENKAEDWQMKSLHR